MKYKKITIKKGLEDVTFVQKTSDNVEILDLKELQIEKDRILFKMDGLNKRLAEIDEALSAK